MIKKLQLKRQATVKQIIFHERWLKAFSTNEETSIKSVLILLLNEFQTIEETLISLKLLCIKPDLTKRLSKFNSKSMS